MNALIPPSHYHLPGAFEAEQRALFGRLWICAGFRRELGRNDDYLCRDIGGSSVVVRNFHGELRAFHNVCSHRFNRIHAGRGGNGPFQCSYHGWAYDEAGLPCAIPKRPRFDDLSPERLCSLRLRAWQVETCGDLVFVKRDGGGPSLREFLGASFDTVERMTGACGARIDRNEMTIRANWKIVVENTLESYHVGFVHPDTFSRLQLGEGVFGWQPPHSTWAAPLGSRFTARSERLMAAFDSRPVRLDGYLHQLVFPNVTIASTQGTSFSVQFFEPVGPAETRFSSHVFQTRLDDPPPGASPVVEALNASVRDFNRAVFAEDRDVCEQVQLGSAETGQGGILSDEELRVGDFQAHYLRLMEAGS